MLLNPREEIALVGCGSAGRALSPKGRQSNPHLARTHAWVVGLVPGWGMCSR